MDQDGKTLQCARTGCGRLSVGRGRYCSDSCRAKASHARNYVRVKPPKPSKWDGPLCWCGRPGRYPESGRPKCGNHNGGRRAEKAKWRKLFRQLQDKYTIEEVRRFLHGEETKEAEKVEPR